MSSPARATALVLFLFSAGVISGAWTGATAAARAQDPYASLDLLARVLTTIETDYVDPVAVDDLVQAAIRGMVSDLDPHSRWLSPEEFRALQEGTDGSYEGIGIEVRRVPEGVLVGRVLPGSPAVRVGLAPGDRIVSIDGHPIAGLDLDAVAALLKGPRGQAVRVGVTRSGWAEPRELEVVRDRVETPSIEPGVFLEAGVAYTRLMHFQRHAARDLRADIERLATEAPLQGLILDLRDNPGGLLEEAVAVTDLFLHDGVLVSTRGRLEENRTYPASPDGVSPELRLVVLINGMSASASEIVAGALQDTGRAVLVGTPSYGKGSVQQLVEARDRNGALKLTISRYYTPSGQPVADRHGRVPDHVVPLPGRPTPHDELRDRLSSLEADDRAELLALLERLPRPEAAEPFVPWDDAPRERMRLDPQLAKAVELLAFGTD